MTTGRRSPSAARTAGCSSGAGRARPTLRPPSRAPAAARPASSPTRPSAPAARASTSEGGRPQGDPGGRRGVRAPPERLLMVDYQQLASDDDEPPDAERRVRRLRQLEARPPRSRRHRLAAAAAVARGRYCAALDGSAARHRAVPVLAGIVVIFIAFSGGPGAAREAYLTRGGRVFTVVMCCSTWRWASRSRPP